MGPPAPGINFPIVVVPNVAMQFKNVWPRKYFRQFRKLSGHRGANKGYRN